MEQCNNAGRCQGLVSLMGLGINSPFEGIFTFSLITCPMIHFYIPVLLNSEIFISRLVLDQSMVIKKKCYTVGVTGFAVRMQQHPPYSSPHHSPLSTDRSQPFREYDYNTSAMVRDGLPALIKRKDKSPITILKYPHDIKCIYTDVLVLTPELWSGKRSVYELGSSSHKTFGIDLMLHIGMHPDDDVYFFEKRARRGKYEHAGEDRRLLSRDALKGQPDTLFVELDVENIVARVAKSMPVRWPCLEVY